MIFNQEQLNGSIFKAIMQNNSKAEIKKQVNDYFTARHIKTNDNLDEIIEKGIYFHTIEKPLTNEQEQLILFDLDIADADATQQKQIFYIPYTSKITFDDTGNARDISKVYNSEYLKEETAQEIYINDNIFDTLLIETLKANKDAKNYKAITIFNDADAETNNSILTFKELIKEHKSNLYKTTFNVIVKDRTLENLIIETLKENKLKYNFQTIPNNYKCFNEFYIKDTAKATKELETAIAINDDTVSNYYNKFLEQFEDNLNQKPIKTGFNCLDAKLKGLVPGLYSLGALSSLGKTTFMLQLAEQIIENNEDKQAIFFSLEQSKYELLAKSLSRHIFQVNAEEGNKLYTKDLEHAIASQDIMQGKADIDQVVKAMTHLKPIANRLIIKDDEKFKKVSAIRQYIETYIRYNNTRPIIFIDYLQILDAENQKIDKRIAIDDNVRDLRIMSKVLQVPIFIISSFNRANYYSEVSYNSFKESGNIEYSSDLIFALQYKLEGKNEDEIKANLNTQRANATKNGIDIELVILKNRNGTTGNNIAFRFYPTINTFQETIL